MTETAGMRSGSESTGRTPAGQRLRPRPRAGQRVAQMPKPVVVPGWLLLSVLVVIAANLVAGAATSVTIHLMHGVSPFALAVQAHDEAYVQAFRSLAYPALTAIT